MTPTRDRAKQPDADDPLARVLDRFAPIPDGPIYLDVPTLRDLIN